MLSRIDRLSSARRFLSCLLGFGLAVGCAQETIEFREVQRVDEAILESDLESIYRMAEIMTNGRLPEMSPHFLPEPSWDPERPAAISTLVGEELTRLEETTDLDKLAASIKNNPRLDFARKKEGLSREQYAGLILSVGLAYQRHLLDPARDLEVYVRVGQETLSQLKQRQDSFATLTPEHRVDTLDDATWITRVDRARRIREVPAANVSLVAAQAERLAEVLPPQFLTDPLQGLNDPRIDFGVPFRELGKTGFDADMIWDRKRDRAVISGEATVSSNEAGWIN